MHVLPENANLLQYLCMDDLESSPQLLRMWVYWHIGEQGRKDDAKEGKSKGLQHKEVCWQGGQECQALELTIAGCYRPPGGNI